MLLAFVITLPVAWRAMHVWLQQFAYRVDISWWIFTAAGAIAVLAALAAVCTQTLKAAMASPLRSLRVE
ncbi:hypothetical protein EGT74_13290 [Chitinophaga lutea]|uniref:FtsX-like permease family protein n=1 Tax=Chitinophaga lutea TaxID=2488634 RepID=A0A3N4PH66_9BACT|nr:hypothetical protein [Chitinophaga lutea]RPE08042.1 hypothetical protein EGT74_13290 [Chitinophaga lutea]